MIPSDPQSNSLVDKTVRVIDESDVLKQFWHAQFLNYINEETLAPFNCIHNNSMMLQQGQQAPTH